MYRLDDHPSALIGAFISGSFDNGPAHPSSMAAPARLPARIPRGLQSQLIALWVSLAAWIHAAPNHPAVD